MGQFDIKKLGNLIESASISAINRAAQSAVTAASKFIRTKYAFKKKDLDEHIKLISRAEPGRSYASVKISKSDVSLMVFNAKQVGKGGRPRKGKGPRRNQGVKASVEVGKRKLYRSKDNDRGSFIAAMESGHVGVFIREDKERVSGLLEGGVYSFHKEPKIKELFGINVQQLFITRIGKGRATDVMYDAFDEAYEKRLDHELKRRSR